MCFCVHLQLRSNRGNKLLMTRALVKPLHPGLLLQKNPDRSRYLVSVCLSGQTPAINACDRLDG